MEKWNKALDIPVEILFQVPLPGLLARTGTHSGAGEKGGKASGRVEL